MNNCSSWWSLKGSLYAHRLGSRLWVSLDRPDREGGAAGPPPIADLNGLQTASVWAITAFVEAAGRCTSTSSFRSRFFQIGDPFLRYADA